MTGRRGDSYDRAQRRLREAEEQTPPLAVVRLYIKWSLCVWLTAIDLQTTVM